MRIPGALPALAVLAAISLAPDGARAQQITIKNDAENEVINGIADVTRFDSALGGDTGKRRAGDRSTDAVAPATPERKSSDREKAENQPAPTDHETGRTADAHEPQPEAGEAEPTRFHIIGAKPAAILPGEAADRNGVADDPQTVLHDAVRKAAESAAGKIIDFQGEQWRSPERLPVVVRGVIPDDQEEATASAEPPSPPSGWRVISGRNFWFYNREEGLLIGCRLVGTAKVGDNKRVKCSRPRRAPDFH